MSTLGFIFQKSGLKPPTSGGKDPTVRRRRSKPLNPSTLVGGGSVNGWTGGKGVDIVECTFGGPNKSYQLWDWNNFNQQKVLIESPSSQPY